MLEHPDKNNMSDGKNINSDFLMPKKPLLILEDIFKILKTHSDQFSLKKGDEINLLGADGTPCLVFITCGRFSVYRKHDGLLIHSSFAPSLFGLVEYFQPRNAHFILGETECTGIKINTSLAFSLFTKYEMWESITQVQSYIIQVLQTRDFQLVGVNAYLIIKNKLLELLHEPEEVKMKQSVLLYIQLRSKLSKSLVSKILSALRTGGYIEMKNGKLISINYLPKDY